MNSPPSSKGRKSGTADDRHAGTCADVPMPKNFESEAAQLLPNNVVADLADLAIIPEPRRVIFANQMRKAIWSANINVVFVRPGLPHARASDVADALKPLKMAAKDLEEALAVLVRDLRRTRTVATRLDAALRALGGKDTDARKYHAKMLALGSLQGWSDHQHYLKKLIDEISLAEPRAISISHTLIRRGRPKGAGGNRAFNTFVNSLDQIADANGGKWTLSSDPVAHPKERWTGTLMDAMEILRPHLPEGFFPDANLGRSLEHVRMPRKPRTTKIRP
jgi:hypothetical protein